MKLKAIISLGFFVGLALMPNAIKRRIYNAFLGAEIHSTARIGFSYVQAGKIKMGPYSRIGHLNVIRNLELLEIGEKALIGNLNSVSAFPLSDNRHFVDETHRFPALILEEHSDIVSRNYFDCCHTIRIGHHTIIAGSGSVFFTHGINIEQNKQEAKPITVGNHAMIGARCVVVKGASLPDCSVLGANSTLSKPLEQPYRLYSGVPAMPVKELNPASQYFHRKIGYVS